MHRIDTPTAQKDKFGVGKNGFTRGNPQTGTPATDLDDDYFDMLQEELAGVVEAAGIALDKTKRNQLMGALFRLGAGAPAIGIPFFWPSSAMPNTVIDEWADMVFLKFNGSTFSATTYPKLALVIPGLTLPDARGEFPRIWDDGRGVDSGRAILSAQLDALQNITGSFNVGDNNDTVGGMGVPTGAFTGSSNPGKVPVWTNGAVSGTRYITASFNAGNVARTSAETRPRNIAFNFLVRAK